MNRHGYSRPAPDTLLPPPPWANNAACREADPDLFFPEGTTSEAWAMEAKSWCARCLVIEDCLEDALSRREAHGVWGGTDVQERRVILRRRRERERAAHQDPGREEGADAFGGPEPPVSTP